MTVSQNVEGGPGGFLLAHPLPELMIQQALGLIAVFKMDRMDYY